MAFSNITVGVANFCGRLTLIILGIVLISNGLSSVGNFVSAFQLSSLMIAPVVRAAQILNIHGAGRASRETLFAEYPLALPAPRRSATTEFLEIPDTPTMSFTDLLVSPGGRDDTPRSRVANTVLPFGSNWRVSGPSGCGKTTLCGVIAGVHPPYQGDVTIDHRPVSGFEESSRFRWLQYVPQDAHLVQASVWDNVTLGRSMPSWVVKDALERAGFELRGDQVPSLEKRDPLEWSGGERQRICLARALCLRPRILILDEGLSQVDTPTRNSILQRLLSDKELTFIFVSHHEFDGEFGTIYVRNEKK